MKNKLADLNDHLFAQLERLSEEGLDAEKLKLEVDRGAGIVAVADQIIRNAELTFKAASLVANHGDRFRPALQNLIAPSTPSEAPTK